MADQAQTLLQVPVPSKVTENDGTINQAWRQFFANQSSFLSRISELGFQISPMETADRDTLPPKAPGQTIFNATLNKLQVWNGTEWETIQSST